MGTDTKLNSHSRELHAGETGFGVSRNPGLVHFLCKLRHVDSIFTAQFLYLKTEVTTLAHMSST